MTESDKIITWLRAELDKAHAALATTREDLATAKAETSHLLETWDVEIKRLNDGWGEATDELDEIRDAMDGFDLVDDLGESTGASLVEHVESLMQAWTESLAGSSPVPEEPPKDWRPGEDEMVTGKSRRDGEPDPVGKYAGQVGKVARIRVLGAWIDALRGSGRYIDPSMYRYVDLDTLRPAAPAVLPEEAGQ